MVDKYSQSITISHELTNKQTNMEIHANHASSRKPWRSPQVMQIFTSHASPHKSCKSCESLQVHTSRCKSCNSMQVMQVHASHAGPCQPCKSQALNLGFWNSFVHGRCVSVWSLPARSQILSRSSKDRTRHLWELQVTSKAFPESDFLIISLCFAQATPCS